MDDLYTATVIEAHKTGKRPSKKVAHDTLRELLDNLDADTLGPRNTARLAELWAHFLPAPTKKPKTDWDWLALALANPAKEYREWLHGIHVTEGRALATDGHRVHATSCGLPNGFYTREGVRLGDLPNPDAVAHMLKFADEKRTLESTQTMREGDASITQSGKEDPALHFTFAGGESVVVNQRYWREALARETEGEAFGHVQDKASHVRLTLGARRAAVIMPIRY